jgi:S-ribosylhomocysteine lyase LuxS involved in autoinducer biosynthesis
LKPSHSTEQPETGIHPTWLNLGAMGIRGNGHMMMLEKNSDQIADVMEKWVSKVVSAGKAAPAAPSEREEASLSKARR